MLPRTLLDLTAGEGWEERTAGAKLAGWGVEGTQRLSDNEQRAEVLRRAEAGSYGAAVSATHFPSLSRVRKGAERGVGGLLGKHSTVVTSA